MITLNEEKPAESGDLGAVVGRQLPDSLLGRMEIAARKTEGFRVLAIVLARAKVTPEECEKINRVLAAP